MEQYLEKLKQEEKEEKNILEYGHTIYNNGSSKFLN